MPLLYTLILFFPFFVTLFWIIIFFYNRKKNLRSQNVWIFCLLVACICTFIWGILFGGNIDYSLYYKLDAVDLIFTLSFFPFIYFYFRTFTGKKKLTWKQYSYLLPGIISGIVSAFIYWLMGDEQATDYIQLVIETPYETGFPVGSLQWAHYLIDAYLFTIILFLQVIGVMSYSTINLIRYSRGLRNSFSSLDEKSIGNNRAILIYLYVLLIIALIAIGGWSWFYELYYNSGYFLMIIMGISLFHMSYYVFKMQFAAENLPDEPDEPVKIATNSNETGEYYVKFVPEFIKLIEEDKVFLQPTISLEDIARHINTNRTYIYNIINEKYHTNFHDFINKKRVEFAKDLYVKNPQLTQEQIAGESGFLYASTFSRIFKKQEGITFRQWQKIHMSTNDAI